MQLVLQHCCKTSCKAMLRLLLPSFKAFNLLQDRFDSVGGKTCNIAIQLVLQWCCKTGCMFFVARFIVPLARTPFVQDEIHRCEAE